MVFVEVLLVWVDSGILVSEDGWLWLWMGILEGITGGGFGFCFCGFGFWMALVVFVLAFASGLFLFLVTGWDNRGYGRMMVDCFTYILCIDKHTQKSIKSYT